MNLLGRPIGRPIGLRDRGRPRQQGRVRSDKEESGVDERGDRTGVGFVCSQMDPNGPFPPFHMLRSSSMAPEECGVEEGARSARSVPKSPVSCWPHCGV